MVGHGLYILLICKSRLDILSWKAPAMRPDFLNSDQGWSHDVSIPLPRILKLTMDVDLADGEIVSMNRSTRDNEGRSFVKVETGSASIIRCDSALFKDCVGLDSIPCCTAYQLGIK